MNKFKLYIKGHIMKCQISHSGTYINCETHSTSKQVGVSSSTVFPKDNNRYLNLKCSKGDGLAFVKFVRNTTDIQVSIGKNLQGINTLDLV